MVWFVRLPRPRDSSDRTNLIMDVVCTLCIALTPLMTITALILLGSIFTCAKRNAAQPPDPETVAIMADIDAINKAYLTSPRNTTLPERWDDLTFYPTGPISTMISATCMAAASFVFLVSARTVMPVGACALSFFVRFIAFFTLFFGASAMGDWYKRRKCAGLVQAAKGPGMCSPDRICDVWKAGFYITIAEFLITALPSAYVSVAPFLPVPFR